MATRMIHPLLVGCNRYGRPRNSHTAQTHCRATHTPEREAQQDATDRMQAQAVLLAFDRPAQAQRCQHTVRMIRSGAHGNFSGAIELVGPAAGVTRKMSELVRNNAVLYRTLDEILSLEGRTYATAINRQAPPPCPGLPRKRRRGWAGYYYKTLVSMASFWAAKYDAIMWMDCGTHVHYPLGPLLEIDPGQDLIALSATWPSRATLAEAYHAKCDPVANRSLLRAYPLSLSSPYFISTVMKYRTSLLGTSNAALKSIVSLYHRFGALFEGDQNILSLYWRHERQAWRPLPMTPPHCIFDYAFRVPHPAGCRTLVLSKLTYLESYHEARHRGGGRGGYQPGLSRQGFGR
jgi:hypothetical protein